LSLASTAPGVAKHSASLVSRQPSPGTDNSDEQRRMIMGKLTGHPAFISRSTRYSNIRIRWRLSKVQTE